MALVSSLSAVTIVSCLMLFTGFVSSRASIGAYRRQREFGCVESLAICALPVLGFNSETIVSQVQQYGLDPICSPLLTVKNCIAQAKEMCEDEDVPAELEQAINLITRMVDFVCVTERASIEADRACMFGKALDTAVDRNCNAEASGQICRLSEDMDCALEQYERVCRNKRLADKLRDLAADIEKDSNCDKHKAYSMTWRQLVKALRR